MAKKFVDIVGKKFGKWYVMEEVEKTKQGSRNYLCKCDCGTQKKIPQGELTRGKTKSCGCAVKLPKPKKVKEMLTDIVGNRYGKLVVLKPTERKKNSKQFYLCKCDCGIEKEVSRCSLISKTKGITSCGCSLQDFYDNNLIDLTGKQFGLLTAIERNTPKIGDDSVRWICNCECGTIGKIVSSAHLIKGAAKSCGCKQYNREDKRKYEPLMANVLSVFRKYRDGDLTIEKFIELTTKNCTYCGNEPYMVRNVYSSRKTMSAEEIKEYEFVYNGLDRLNSNKSHTVDNCVPCCFTCNTAKMAMTVEEFRDWIIKVYNHFILEEQKD